MTVKQILINSARLIRPSLTEEEAVKSWERVFKKSSIFIKLCSWNRLSAELSPLHFERISYDICAKAWKKGWDFDEDTKNLLNFLQYHIRGEEKKIRMEDFL
jgi:hypothetical protein